MTTIRAVTTQVATFELENPLVLRGGSPEEVRRFYDNVVVHVDTDEGVRGSANVFVAGGRGSRDPDPDSAAFLLEAAVRHISGAVVGENLFAYNRIWNNVFARYSLLGRGVIAIAHSGVDMAIWDAIGKLSGRPLHHLLGATRETVPVYSTEMFEAWNAPIDDYVAKAHELVGRGLKALKMIYTAPEAEWLERVAAVREAVGPGIGLMVDIALHWKSYEQALAGCRRLEAFNLMWIEDPLPAEFLDQHARLCAEIHTPIAAGERYFALPELKLLIDKQAMDILTFEPTYIGGVTGCARLAAIAQSAGVPLAVHANADLGVNLIAAFPTGMIMEYLPWWGVLFESPFTPTPEGVGIPSQKPGNGCDFDVDALERLRVYPQSVVTPRP